GNDIKPVIDRAPSDKISPILEGIETPFTGQGSLYKASPLASSAMPLLMGTIPGHAPEPVAWVNVKGGMRIFYTSLGHPGDFGIAAFRRLLRNAVSWTLDRPSPARTTSPSVDTKTPADKAGQSPRPPDPSLASFRIPDDLQLELVLSEPTVRQPVSMSFDER